MHVSRTLAAILGLVTRWPPLYFLLFMGFVFGAVFPGQSERLESVFQAVFAVHLVTMLVVMSLLAFYVVHLFKNETLPSDRRVLWAIVLFMGNLFAFPVYWYIHVWLAPARGSVDRPA
jgi:hypothetical protein